VEREALGLLEFLFAKPLRRADIREHLRRSPMLRPQAREMALAQVERYREEASPEPYYRAAWTVVRQQYLNAFQYRLALRQAETACELAPGQVRYLRTLGVAQYRNSKQKEALKTLTRADQLAKDNPVNLAFLAMTRHQLGEGGQARATLVRLREVMKKPESAANAEAETFLREAAALIEGKPDQDRP
jgi:Flp pilus assembly protein TadD